MLKSRSVNTYLAILCITIFGAGAAMIIVKIASAPASFDRYTMGVDPLSQINNLNIQPPKQTTH